MSERFKKVETPPKGETVRAGSNVELRFLEETEDDIVMVRLVAGHDSSPESNILPLSTELPLGQALIGANVGDVLTYDTPEDGEMSVEVVAVDNS